MSYENLEEEIDGEIIVLGRDDGGSHFKWYGETVNPMKIKDKQIILPTIEEYMENLDILVRDIHINEGEYKSKTDRLQKIWRKENEDEDASDEDSDEIAVEEMLMNGETVFLDEENGNVYDMEANGIIGIATRLNRNTWTIFNNIGSRRSPDILTYN
tara:strand:- start:42 stop:512 length:471 start_codon:yes stop_codon:yes gene_type:complete